MSKQRDNITAIEAELNRSIDSDKFPDWDFQKINETFRVSEEIFKTLSPEAVAELTNNTDEKGLLGVFDTVLEETYGVLYGKHLDTAEKRITSETFGYLNKLTESVEETLRCENLVYFITSVLQDFELNWHTLEWCEIYQLYKRAAIIAARDHGKSHLFSNAIPAWNCYRFKGKLGKNPSERNPRGFIFSFSIQQAIDLLEILQNTIEDNEILRNRLYDKNKFSKTEIRCLNKARVTVKGFGSSVRGAHPGWIIIDDPLKDNVLFSKLQREKSNSYFHSVIMNMIVPGGPVHVIGCVAKDSWIATENGLEQIIKLAPNNRNLYKKNLKNFNLGLYGINNEYNQATKFWCNGITDTVKITTECAYELEASQPHPIMVLNEDHEYKWKSTKDLKIGDWILVKGKIENLGRPIKIKGEFKYIHRNITDNRFKYPDYLTSDLAYLIGLIIAEGCFDKSKNASGVGISATEKQITDFLSSRPFGLNFRLKPSNNGWACGCKEFYEFLRWLGTKFVIAPFKEVPYKLMQAETNIVAGFLQGFFDGDGGSSDKDGSVGCASTSKKLIHQIRLLLLHHFGIDSSITKHQPGISERATGKYHVYNCRIGNSRSLEIFYNEIGFRLDRKQKNKKFIKFGDNIRIPDVSELIIELRQYIKWVGVYPFLRVARDTPSTTIDKIKKILDLLRPIAAQSEAYEKLFYLYDLFTNKNYKTYKIKSLKSSKSFTFDFVVPNTNSFISNGIVSHNTPFHSLDLYGDLKTKKGWHVFEYPGIFPDGRLLWGNRWNFEGLMGKKEDQGNLIFSREILCRPISADSTIFPPNVLNTAFFGMDEFTLVQNRESYKKKFSRVIIGCDFAISGSVGADYTVFLVWGIDDLDRMWLMQVYRAKGASYAEQLAMLKRFNTEFRPELILLEANTFQQIFVQESEKAGLPVMPHVTTQRKNDLKEGLPGLAILFERGKFKIPTGDQRSKDNADEMVLEFSSVAYTDEHGLCATAGHDDLVMASWISVECARMLTTGGLGFNFTFA